MNIFYKIPYYFLHRNPFFGLIFKYFIREFHYKYNGSILSFEIPFKNLTLGWLPGFLFKTYELNDVSLIKKHIVKNEKVLNIGGGIGFIASLVYKITNEKVTIVEVDDRIIEILNKNLKRNKINFQLIDKPLSLSKETDFLINKNQNYISNTTIQKTTTDNNPSNSEFVDSKFFDKFDVLVIDAEGYEEYFFSNLLEINFDKIIIEFHPKNYLNLTSQDIENILTKNNYKEMDSYFQSKVFKKNNY